MSGVTSARRDTPAARAALARRRQRAAQALQPQQQQPNNTLTPTTTPTPTTTSKVSHKPPSLRINTNNTSSTSATSSNVTHKLSPLAQRTISKHISSPSNATTDGSLTTAGMTTESSFTEPPQSHKIQSVIHYTSKQKQTNVSADRRPTLQAQQPTKTITTRAPAPPPRSRSNNSSSKPLTTISSTPRSSAALNARLNRARFRSQSPSRRLPPSLVVAPTTTTTTATTPSSTSSSTGKKQTTTSAPTTKTTNTHNRATTKPPFVSTQHVANKTTTTAHALASSPTRAALRNRMQPTTNITKAATTTKTVTAATTKSSPRRQPPPPPSPSSSSNKMQPTTTSPRSQPSPSKRQQPLLSSSSSPSRSSYPSPNQRLAQQAQAKHNAHMGTPIHRTPQRTPKTYLDESFADMSTILDRTLPPLEDTTPNNKQFVSHPTTKNESILLEDYYCYSDDQQTSQPSSSSMDAACLQNQSTVLLRSCSSNTTIQVSNNNNDKENHLALPADPSGLCLGRPEEVLAIDKTGTDTSLQLRHGDTICLVFGGSFSLGVKKTASSSSSSSSSMELAFHHKDAIGGKADHHWTILLVKPGKKVLVGRAAVAANNRKSNRTNGKPICSGDPILLRHVPTGGVLSMNSTELKLVTDSYASQQAQDPSLMDRLHHHDQLLPSKDEVFQLLLSSTPPCPPWLVSGSSSIDERIFLTGSYLLHPQRHQAEFEYQMSQEDRMELSSSIKEKILIDEVIGSFLGLEGRHIKIQPQGPINGGGDASSSTASLGLESFSFQLFGTDGVDFDRSLRNLVEQILPMSTSYVRVQNFISSHHPGYEYGRVMQAFCEGLDALLQDYVNFVVQMERQHRKYKKADSSLTMKSIYFQITPSLHSMSILEHATRAVREKKGGALINALWSLEKLVYMGDMVAKKVLGILLEKSSIPYVEMMSAWLQSGRLADPYGEFMVQRSTDKSNVAEFDGDAWMALFSVNEDHILEGVTSDKWTKEKILTTGKYWNAVHACHVDVDKMQGDVQKIPRLPFNSDSSAILSYIDAMYQNASRVLVQLMKDDFKLKESLLVMKRYFLLDQGDFVTHFLDRAEEELRKQSEDVSVSRIQNWLNLSIQLTEAHREDAHGANNRCPLIPQGLRCRFSGKSLVSYLDSLYGDIVDRTPLTPSRQAYGMPKQGNTGIEVFAIDFPRIPFPISLILSQHAMGNYKLLFRHLFFTKHVERRLIGVWRDHQILKKLDSLRGLLGPTFLLRQRMLHFVQNLLYYMSFEVIDNNWAEMISSIDKSNDPKNNDQQTVDDILNVHNAFLQRTLEACLLTNQELIRSLTKLLNTCLLFTDQMKRFMDTTKIYDDSTILATEKRVAVQRNLNERGITQSAGNKKKAVRRALISTRQEREALIHRQTRRVGREVTSDSYQRMVQRFDEVFTADLFDVMMQLNSHTASGLVANLGVRLDYNGFVTASIRSFDMGGEKSRPV